MKREVVLKPSYGSYHIQGELLEIMNQKEYDKFNIKARTDQDIISLVKKHKGKLNDIEWQYLSVYEVDTSRPWTIDSYDGCECIEYLDEYELIDKELNYHR